MSEWIPGVPKVEGWYWQRYVGQRPGTAKVEHYSPRWTYVIPEGQTLEWWGPLEEPP